MKTIQPKQPTHTYSCIYSFKTCPAHARTHLKVGLDNDLDRGVVVSLSVLHTDNPHEQQTSQQSRSSARRSVGGGEGGRLQKGKAATRVPSKSRQIEREKRFEVISARHAKRETITPSTHIHPYRSWKCQSYPLPPKLTERCLP